jgi:16S rRNA (uracil1498-N3)-methyltransferase
VSAGPSRDPADTNAVAHVFVEALDDRCEITGDDGHHLQRVRRLTAGEPVTAADGSGAWRSYVVTDVGNGHLVLEAFGDTQPARSPSIPVSLAVALTKGGLEDVVASATELGVARIIPVRTARTVVRWDDSRAQRAVGRLRSVAREAAMQSRRASIPIVDDVVDLAALAGRADLVVAARDDGVGASELPAPGDNGWLVLVGPEGGLAPDELTILGRAPRLRLGTHVLRAATAPVAAVAVLTAEVGRLRPE